VWAIQDSHGGEIISLSQLSPGQVAVVVTPGRGGETRRLAEGGLTPGSLIMALGPGRTSGPVRFVLRGCCVALRAETARAVKVRPTGEFVPVNVCPGAARAMAGLSAACLLAAGNPCLAARPPDTDDPGTTPAGTWCTESGLDHQNNGDTREGSVGLARLYGLNESSDLCLEAPYADVCAGEEHASGIGGFCVTAKWRLREERGGQPALGLACGVSVPCGAVSPVRGERIGWGMDLLAAKSFGPTSLYTSVGVACDGSGANVLTWGLACERPFGKRRGLATEIRGDHTANEDAIGGLVGLTCHLQDGLTADFAPRRDLPPGGRSRGWTAGVTREW
jgi:Fe2+ transport system protein FeoA